jgi:hypothetical protein
MRPRANDMTLPAALFDWVAAAGSRVRAFHIQIGYLVLSRLAPFALHRAARSPDYPICMMPIAMRA